MFWNIIKTETQEAPHISEKSLAKITFFVQKSKLVQTFNHKL